MTDEKKVATVWQTGYGCGHATRSMTDDELKAAGYTHYRITGFLDVDGPCPACKEKRSKPTGLRKKRVAS